MSEKKKTIKEKCIEVAPKVWASHPIARPIDFVEQVAPLTLKETYEDCSTWTEEDKKCKLEKEKECIFSSVRKALYRLAKEGKIGLHSKARYVPLDVAVSNNSRNYLMSHLRPTRDEMQQVTCGTYILPIIGDDTPTFPDFETKQYDEVSAVGADLNKLFNFVKQMAEEKSKKVTSARLLSQHIRTFIGKEYCYDVVVLEDRIIIILDIVKIEASETDMSKEKVLESFKILVKEIYDITYNPPKPKIKLVKKE